MMMYHLIRIALSALALILAILLMRLIRGKIKKYSGILSAAVFLALLFLISMFPIENLFVTFETPEEVFSYTSNEKIEAVVYGEDSAMVIYRKKANEQGVYFVPKENGAYKIPRSFGSKEIADVNDKNGAFSVILVKGTNDCYISGIIPGNSDQEDPKIYNNSGEVADCVQFSFGNSNFIYAVVQDVSTEHYLRVNGDKVYLLN